MMWAQIAQQGNQMGGSMASAWIQNKATQQGLKQQSRAINLQQYVSPTQMRDVSRQGDIEQWVSGYNLQKEHDPLMAGIRDAAFQGMLTGLQDIQQGTGPAGQAVQLATQLGSAAGANLQDPQIQQLTNALLSRANEEMALGGQLAPEFQGELVRAGLERGAQGGFSPGAGILGRNVRQLFGAAGEQLRQQRLQSALGAGTGALGMRQQQQAGAQQAAGFLQNLAGARQQMQSAGGQTAESLVPRSIGLSGDEIANIMTQNIADYNARMIGQGNIAAARNLSRGNMYNQMVGAETQAVNNILGMFGGGGGGGGMMGG